MRLAIFVVALLTSLGGGAWSFLIDDEFSHETHAGMFPLCAGCHEGVPTGDAARTFPAPTVCAGCHNGVEQKKVTWTKPRGYKSNLAFSHPDHDRKQPMECAACHMTPGTARMTTVKRSEPATCFACHAHPARDHFVDAKCSQCHVPLARTQFAAQRVEALPVPPSHKDPGFLEKNHGELSRSSTATCQTCHTQERCAACHVDAKQRPEIRAMMAAGPQLVLPAMKSRYFLPESHKQSSWIDKHGASAQTKIADCASCHTRESCSTCHAVDAPKIIASLTRRADSKAPGVAATASSRRMPASHNTPYFQQQHGVLATTAGQTCASCHKRNECEACHSALTAAAKAASATKNASIGAYLVTLVKSSVTQDTVRRRAMRKTADYHPPNFMERHGSPAYGRKLECSNCHDNTRFCRDCHEQRGMGTTGRLEAGFHDAQPNWLLNHGKPARQGMESCASCHKQRDCMQCHSSLGSFRVNPHGPAFEAARVQQRNARLCLACHLSDPLGGT
jgi:hypothetical protein